MSHAIELGLSAQQVADHLGVAEKTVRRWIESGKLPAMRRGKTFAIDLAAAEAVFAQSRSSRGASKRSEAEVRAVGAEAALAELRGRYAELREYVARVERDLAEERRRVAVLEVRAEVRAA